MKLALKLHIEPQMKDGRPISELGIRLRKIRKQIESAAERGETTPLSTEQLRLELNDLRGSDSDLIDSGILIAAARGFGEYSEKSMLVLSNPGYLLLTSPFVRLEVLPKVQFIPLHSGPF